MRLSEFESLVKMNEMRLRTSCCIAAITEFLDVATGSKEALTGRAVHV